ncbi:MAG: CooT family nickel-binding protein [Dethiobacteria bacterium]|nr:CooT family nickel-binding protein [Bacillota bacterium]NMD33926.1 CooT family nickel-binding protein [Bacillota bacterium]HOB29730.1 CooT family nickel-binding protein [Bacillota bacterium]HPZ42299.1 CooT family nickel-binding protein [Bacillota bacterium]HQD53184.1 CooT family nickel-binding protein [Bacillota bacterium]
MCQSSVYLVKDGREELVMEDVSVIKPQGDDLLLVGMLGEKKQVKAKIKELQLMDHRILLEE